MDALAIFEGLDCSVCLERLDETCKVLPCQHTFCKGCLKAIVASRQELRCPECRRLVIENVDDLPGNITLIRLLNGLKDRQTRKHISLSTRSKVSVTQYLKIMYASVYILLCSNSHCGFCLKNFNVVLYRMD